MLFFRFFVFLVLSILIFYSSAYSLRMVRDKGHVLFYNDRGLKVKSYYIRDNRVLYINRYYYSSDDLCVKRAVWKNNSLVSVMLYRYYKKLGRVRLKKYYYKNKFRYLIRYDIHGFVVEKSFVDDDDSNYVKNESIDTNIDSNEDSNEDKKMRGNNNIEEGNASLHADKGVDNKVVDNKVVDNKEEVLQNNSGDNGDSDSDEEKNYEDNRKDEDKESEGG